MLKEEMIYEDAVEVLEKAFKGETVSQINLGIATLILKDVFPKIYEMRVQKEIAKEASEWKDEIK